MDRRVESEGVLCCRLWMRQRGESWLTESFGSKRTTSLTRANRTR